MIKSKKIILIVLMFVLSSCMYEYRMSKHKTVNLLETEKYIYKISIPNNWRIFLKSTKDVEQQFILGIKFPEPIALIINNPPEKGIVEERNIIFGRAIGGEMKIFALEKNSEAYESLLLKLKDWGIEILMPDFSNEKIDKKVSEKLENYIYNSFVNDDIGIDSPILYVFFDIGENKAFFIKFEGFSHSINYPYGGYNKKEQQQISKEFHKIINSLHRYKIK